MRALLLLTLLALLSCNGDTDDDVSRPDATSDSGVEPDGGDTSVCETWVVVYDLMPAQFDIRNTPFGRGDSTETVGPGTVRLSFADDGGALGRGPVSMIAFHLELDFVVADVQTDITMEAGPDDCGIAAGTFDGDTIAWSTPVRDYRSHGSLTCRAGEVVCAFAGLPDGEPSPRDSTSDQQMMPFIFTSSTSTVPPNGFIMDFVEIPNDSPGDTFLRFTGRETGRICVRAPTCS